MYTLHNLHVKGSSFHYLIANLNKSKVVDAIIWKGIVCHIFWPQYLIFSESQFTIFTYGIHNLIDSKGCTAILISKEKSHLLAFLMRPYKP